MKTIIIYGASGHGKVVASIARSCNLIIDSFIDDDHNLTEFMGYDVHQQNKEHLPVVLGIGNNKTRRSIVKRGEHSFYEAVIDNTSVIRTNHGIGEGTVIAAAVIINPDAIIGKHAIINTAAVIEHDCNIGNYAHISPNATLSGGVSVGEGAHIGSGAVVIPGISIGKWSVIGAGSVIIDDVPDYATVVGNPGRIIKIDE